MQYNFHKSSILGIIRYPPQQQGDNNGITSYMLRKWYYQSITNPGGSIGMLYDVVVLARDLFL